MQRQGPGLIFSPTDLCLFVESRFASWMDRYALEYPEKLVPASPSDDLELIRRKGREHEDAYIASLVEDGHSPFDPRDARDRFAATLEAMRRGEPMIWQAALAREQFIGYPDLLVRVDGASDLGDHHYLPRDIKLGFSARPKYALQLCAYIEMLEAAQGRRPEAFDLVLGNNDSVTLRTVDHFHYYLEQRRVFVEFHRDFDPERRPIPEMGEDHAHWDAEAHTYLDEIDHLSRVANIRRSQIGRLEAAGITTLTQLAESTADRIPKLDRTVFDRLRRQARLQRESAGLERPRFEVLDPDPDGPPRGLALLPPPSRNDVFFDMEGFPMVEGGLEYLFGVSHRQGDALTFRDWWAHTRDEERIAFEGFIDWVHDRWRHDPSMHIYHYAHYETTALKRLMGVHATREAEIDQLLRNEVFVDLYAIVRHGLLVGEPKYSIKNLERLFRDHRGGEVQSATDSIVEYQRFLDSEQPADWKRSPILEGIRDYNRDDCDSTALLAQWLLARQREHRIVYRGKKAADDPDEAEDELSESNKRRRDLAEQILQTESDPIGRLLGHLVEFHRREDKPKWWEVYRRREMSDDELFEDLACLGQLQRIEGSEQTIRRSTGIRYRFDPDQDTKLEEGNQFFLAHDLELHGTIEAIDREAGEVLLIFGPQMVQSEGWPPPARVSLIPQEFYPIEPLQNAIERQARQWRQERRLPEALSCFLHREPPRIDGHDGGPIVRDGESPSDGCVRVVPGMRATTLSIQGPPGTGKTYTAARTVLDLLSRGKRVGITSNSHKAILNLLAKCAELNGADLRCLKVGGDQDDPLLQRIPGVRHVGGGRGAVALSRDYALVGGTAWHFCRDDMQHASDYLFIDEAGQVSVANLMAMAATAHNLVLVGDQMQLGQPTQAQHPEDSGESTLEYLLRGERTIPADTGVFLDVSYRLHPQICRVNSEAFYEGKLHSAPGCENREIRVPAEHSGILSSGAGIVFVPVEHEGNTQGSDEEAEVVRKLFHELQGLEYTDLRREVVGRLGVKDILVVAPYNMQVRKLRDALPRGSRVGSVDKFQGQEAPVVIVSMCASEGHDSPRGIEFLMNPNRLNVALSRAESLAIVVGHPGLARTRCSTLDQMKLVNLYCRIVGHR
jgi:uncharacterized protein